MLKRFHQALFLNYRNFCLHVARAVREKISFFTIFSEDAIFSGEAPKLGNSTAKKVLDSTTDSEVKAEIKGEARLRKS